MVDGYIKGLNSLLLCNSTFLTVCALKQKLYYKRNVINFRTDAVSDFALIIFSRLTFLGTVGEGAFGVVKQATAYGIGKVPKASTVAVKMLKGK